jgi:hypothetical protein
VRVTEDAAASVRIAFVEGALAKAIEELKKE